MLIGSSPDSLELPLEEGVPDKNDLDRTEILRAFDNGDSRPLRDFLHGLHDRASTLMQTAIPKTSTELAGAFWALTPTVLGLGLACIEISHAYFQNELGAPPGTGGSGKNASIGDTIATLKDIYAKVLATPTTTTNKTCEPPGDAWPIVRTAAEADAQSSTSSSREQGEPACVVSKEKFGRSVEVIQGEYKVEPSVANLVTQVCKVVYDQTGQVEKARSLFESDEDFLEFMEDYGSDKALILETLGRYIEAGHLRAAAGETVAAIRLFAQGGDHDRAAQCLCDAFWQHLPYNTQVTDYNRKQIRTLDKVLSDNVEPSIHLRNELSMFRAIIKCDKQTLEALALTFANDGSGRSNSALLRCLDYLSRQQQDVYEMNFEEMNRLLGILRLFGITYRKITRLSEPETSDAIQRALGFRLDESGLEATISTSSFLARVESVSPLVMRRNDRNEIVVNSRQLGIQIAELLDRHLVSVLSNHAVACFGAKSFGSLCLTYLDERQLECQCHRLHVKREDVPAFYNQQLQLHLRQILVLSQGEPYNWQERRNQRHQYLRRIFEILFPLHDAAGNMASFTSREPGVSEGVIVLREWLQDSICGLNVRNPSAMLKTLLMASALDIERRPDGRKGSILHNVPRTVEGYRIDVDGKPQPLFLDLINVLFRPVEGTVEQGIAFLQHVIKERVRIDLHALVVFLDIFTAIFVGCLRHGRMDQAVIPRSFIFYLSQRPRLPAANVWSISHLLRPLEDLVEAIYSGQNEFRDLKFPYRGRIISRIFRCLVIIGCNSGSTVFQSQVERSISALRKDREDRQFFSLYLGYLKAQNWHELETSAYESLSDCTVDQIVRTVQLTQGQNPPDPSDGLTVLPFTSELSLFAPYILSPLVNDIRKSKLRATANTFVTKPLARSATVTRTRSPALNGQGLKNRGTAEPAIPILVEDLEAPATPGEIKAATVIQMAYRRALRRREAPPPKDRRVKLWYDQCVDAQISLQGPKIYSKYFLGPLVHALIWADTVVRLLKNRKDRIEKKFRPAQIEHTQIEELMARLAVCNDNYKRGVQLQKSLLPNADVHRRGQIQELRKLVSDLKGMAEELNLEAEDSEEHRRLGQKGIFPAESTVTETKPLKSKLNTEDLFEV